MRPLVNELNQNKPAVIQYLKSKHPSTLFWDTNNDIERLKTDCAVAHNLLLDAHGLCCRALAVYRQTLGQLADARWYFGEARNRLAAEVACEEIQSYFKDLDGGKRKK